MKLFDKYGNELRAVASGGRRTANPMAIMEKIASQFKDKSRKDIQKWRTAIQVAEDPKKPRRDLLMDLYDDLLTDGHLSSQMEMRKAATLNTSFHIMNRNTGEIDQEKSDLFNKRWFYEFLEHSLDAKFYGYSLIEFLSFEENKVLSELVPRRNVVPNKHIVIPDLTKADDVINYGDMITQGWLLPVGKTKDLGILNKIIPNLIWKRNIMQSWAEFCERFGIPLMTATTLKQDDETLDLIDGMLSQLGEAAHAVFPQGTTVDIKEANRTDAYMVFDKKILRNNEEISKAITGGTMLSDNGSSKSQSEVHERNLEDRIAPADRRNITFIINDELIPLLIQRGYPFTDDDKFTFDLSQEMPLKEHWKIVKDIEANHIVDSDWIAKTFNVPITGERTQETPAALQVAALENEFKPVAVVGNTATGVHGINLPSYPATACCEDHDVWMVNAAYQNEMEELHNSLAERIYNNQDSLDLQMKITAKEGLRLLKGLRRGWGGRAIEASYNEPDHLMLQMMEYNLFEFAQSKTEARLAAMSQLLIDKDKMGIKSFDEFKTEASKLVDKFNTSYLKTEYNLSVAIGQNSAAYVRSISEQDAIPYVQYITAGDNNVRTEHALLNNRIFAINDTEARRLWPPNAYGCRCEMIQYPHTPQKGSVTSGKNAIKQLGDKFKESQFAINRGDLKQVFTTPQFYHSIKDRKTLFYYSNLA